jgi:hypothetical protein
MPFLKSANLGCSEICFCDHIAYTKIVRELFAQNCDRNSVAYCARVSANDKRLRLHNTIRAQPDGEIPRRDHRPISSASPRQSIPRPRISEIPGCSIQAWVP